jgi:ankyrin repeat protein
MVAYLIKNGADPNAKDNDGYSTIHLSAMFNHPIVVAYLLAKGVDVNKLYYFY